MNYKEGTFIAKVNRFVGRVRLEGGEEPVYIPNTGRLGELLLPGVRVILLSHTGKYRYKLSYVMRNNSPVLVDSVYCNRVFSRLIESRQVSGLKQYRLVRREPAFGRHRFDFLVEDNKGNRKFIELKSCTLAWNGTASFPDAVSGRASEHIRALSDSGDGILIFFILHQNIKAFVPNYHTDFEFYKTLKEHCGKIKVLAFSAVYDKDLRINAVKKIKIHIPDVRPTGSYLIIFRCDNDVSIPVGSPGTMAFQKGYYVYTGSGMNNVFKRIGYHKKNTKTKKWHIDHIKEYMKIISDIPVVTDKNIECLLAEKMKELGGTGMTGFGSTDCRCSSHFYYFADNPLHRQLFWDIILGLRYE